MQAPRVDHRNVVICILKYIKKTPSKGYCVQG